MEQLISDIELAFQTYAQFGTLDERRGPLDNVLDDYRGRFPGVKFENMVDGLKILSEGQVRCLLFDYTLAEPKVSSL